MNIEIIRKKGEKKDTSNHYKKPKAYLKLQDQKGYSSYFSITFSKKKTLDLQPLWMHKTFDKRKDKR